MPYPRYDETPESVLAQINGVQTPVVSQLYVLLETLVFVSLDGHLVIVQVLATSFELMPVGRDLTMAGMWDLVNMGTFVFSGAVSIALPGIGQVQTDGGSKGTDTFVFVLAVDPGQGLIQGLFSLLQAMLNGAGG